MNRRDLPARTGPPGPGLSAFTVSPDRVDLWLVATPDGPGAELLDGSELDEHERERATAFVRPLDALLYTTAHVALRRLLSRYTGIPARDIRFRREPCPGCGEPHGRPSLSALPPALHFSLSHSGEMALVGIAAVPLGVDVEQLPGTETVEVCSRALHQDEQKELAASEEGPARGVVFGRIWTRKEAYLKGLGTGLSRSPAADYLGADTGRHPPGWSVIDIPCGPGHAAAAAVWGPAPATIDVRRFPEAWLRPTDSGRPRPDTPPNHHEEISMQDLLLSHGAPARTTPRGTR